MKLYQLVAKKGDMIIASISSEKESDLDYYEKFYKKHGYEVERSEKDAIL